MNLFKDLLTAKLSAAPMTDLMVDIETTGSDPYHNGMIQLACIEFNYETQSIGRIFNRCLDIPEGRYWDEGTRQWWGGHQEVLQSIYARMEEPRVVIQDFYDWVRMSGELRFWSRGNFDYWFVKTYLNQFGFPMPFSPFTARDLRSYQAGLFNNKKADEPDMKWKTRPGNAHDALHDCAVQLERLFSCQNGVFYEVLSPENVNAD